MEGRVKSMIYFHLVKLRFNDQPYGEEYEEHEEKQEGDGDQLGELDRVEVLKEGGGGVVALAEMGLLQHHLYLRFHKVPTST